MKNELTKINNRLKTIRKQMKECTISPSLAVDRIDKIIERIDKLEK